MMKFLRKAAIPFLILIALAALIYTLRSEGFLSFLSKEKNEQTDIPAAVDTTETEDLLTAENIISKFNMPEDIKGVWLDMNSDISADGEINEFLSELSYDFDYYRNFRANTIFVRPGTDDRYENLKNSDGSSADALSSVIAYADAADYYKVLVVDDELLMNSDKISFKKTDEYLSRYSFNAVLFDSLQFAGNANFSKAIQLFRDNFDQKYSNIAFGAVIHTVIGESYADEYSLNELKNKSLDFVCVQTENSTALKKNSFKHIFGWWNQLAAMLPDTVFICEHRSDLYNSGKKGWDDLYEVADQYKFMADMENFYGRCYYSTAALKKNKACSLRLSGYEYDGFASDYIVNTMAIDPANASVIFTGKANKGTKLLDGHKVLDDNGGKFEQIFQLRYGDNVFRLRNYGKTFTFRIYDNSPLIADHYPDHNYENTDANTVTPYALCRNGSHVKAILNGKEYEMSINSTIPYDDQVGYSLYSCDIDLSKSPLFRTDFGELVIVCENNSDVCRVNCGNVSVNRSENSIVNKIISVFSKKDNTVNNDDTTQKEQSSLPYLNDHGLGNALMCRILSDRTEQLSTVSDYDTYHADYSTLMEGTIDYVNGISLSEEGLIRYELNSGRAVYAENCELINNGFVLPENTLRFAAVNRSEPSKTDFIFDTDWIIPVNVSIEPQQYDKGSADFSFNVKKVTAEYIDVDLYHTVSVSGIENMTFEPTDTVNRAEVLAEKENVITLRLYLTKKGIFYGFNISHNENGQIVLSIKKRNDNSLSGKVIMLDPGHGGLYMTGTALTDQSLAEKEVTLSIGLKAKAILEAKGATVLMTRVSDASYSLEDRVEKCNEASPDVFVSIHCDGSANLASSGTHTLYFRPYSQPLAKSIHENLVKNYSEKIYAEEAENYANIDRKIQYYPYFVTRGDTCPSVLIETGFMTNEIEGRLLADDNVRSWIADGIANGIEDYFKNSF